MVNGERACGLVVGALGRDGGFGLFVSVILGIEL